MESSGSFSLLIIKDNKSSFQHCGFYDEPTVRPGIRTGCSHALDRIQLIIIKGKVRIARDASPKDVSISSHPKCNYNKAR